MEWEETGMHLSPGSMRDHRVFRHLALTPLHITDKTILTSLMLVSGISLFSINNLTLAMLDPPAVDLQQARLAITIVFYW
ncbi:hypothetical protein BO86DRAFT_456925 [Aspergillus japonicus CBS 114.51]|uniref:Uncharacterized protein n=1 Tax=Aspergillus japonicus CBS 114.51 TaxID=1448312 RepID=A0A8T8WZM2_ASPJA|nr:hypothetical protein BO86DRAFT_456925 [Aspergillus japonicus CBS 114.51]RAH80842.1 hypothetical protein BO86DRAFT_456925 [Aspergillus japonicus CBS 114.51]